MALIYPWYRNLDDADPQRDPERPEEIPGTRVVSVLAGQGAAGPDGLDFSGTAVQNSKAVEIAVYHRIFLRFREEPGCGAADVQNEVFQRFMAGNVHLTMGNFSYLLPEAREPALAKFIRKIYGRADEVIWGKGGVLKLLSDQESVQLRNDAAHDKVLDRAAALKMREWAFKVLRLL